jgi:flagellar motor protein MotB
MSKKLQLPFFFLIFITAAQAQKKSELIAQVSELETQLLQLNDSLSRTRAQMIANESKAQIFEEENSELRDANKTLLDNLNRFSQLSKQNTENINRTIESLNQKEEQLKTIHEAIAKNDSLALVVLTNAKQTLGENTNISISNGTIIISASLETIFGSDSSTKVLPTAEDFIKKITDILKANPELNLTIEGLSMTGDLVTPAKQAFAIGQLIQEKFEVDANKFTTKGLDGNLKEGVLFKLHPGYNTFYLMSRASIKN